MGKKLTKEDIEWIQTRYPKFKVTVDGKYIVTPEKPRF